MHLYFGKAYNILISNKRNMLWTINVKTDVDRQVIRVSPQNLKDSKSSTAM